MSTANFPRAPVKRAASKGLRAGQSLSSGSLDLLQHCAVHVIHVMADRGAALAEAEGKSTLVPSHLEAAAAVRGWLDDPVLCLIDARPVLTDTCRRSWSWRSTLVGRRQWRPRRRMRTRSGQRGSGKRRRVIWMMMSWNVGRGSCWKGRGMRWRWWRDSALPHALRAPAELPGPRLGEGGYYTEIGHIHTQMGGP